MSVKEAMVSYKQGDRVKVIATGQLGTVSADSFSAARSVGDSAAMNTNAVLVKLDGGDDHETTLIHEEIEKATAARKEKTEHVQPERAHGRKS